MDMALISILLLPLFELLQTLYVMLLIIISPYVLWILTFRQLHNIIMLYDCDLHARCYINVLPSMVAIHLEKMH